MLALIRAIRGAPLTVLAALLLDRERAMGAGEIVATTGYSGPTVAAALQTLAALNLAENRARYNGWQATAYAWQLIRGEADPVAGVEAKDPCLPSNRRRCSADPDRDQQRDQRQPLRGETKTVCLPDEWQDLVDLLVERCAVPSRQASWAIGRAYEAGHFASYVRYMILRWLAYCLSDHGKGIRNVGAYIASRIAQGLDCPDWFHPPRGDLGREIQRAEAAWHREDSEQP